MNPSHGICKLFIQTLFVFGDLKKGAGKKSYRNFLKNTPGDAPKTVKISETVDADWLKS